jgi:hypothetical protein
MRAPRPACRHDFLETKRVAAIAITPRDRKRIKQFFAILGSSHVGERESARKLDELLLKLKLTWNDLPGLLSLDDPATNANGANAGESVDDDPPVGTPNALELTHFMLQQFVDLKSPHEYLAAALWILHTHVFDRFLVTPRLALLSPVRGCGKTTCLATLETLTARAVRVDDITPAAIYHLIDQQPRTLLIDEIDNAGLDRNGLLRKVLNSGHRKGGSIGRLIDGETKRFSTFAPAALAAIGTLPLPLMSRSIVIDMQRSDGNKTLRRLDDVHAGVDFDLAYRHVFMWARTVKLDPNPAVPVSLRKADNWRVLISISDAFGPSWGAAAREAALALSQGTDEDIGVMLLEDIRDIFDERGVDRITSAELVRHLVAIEDSDWTLTQGRMAVMLKPFKIKPKTIWPQGHRDGESRKGYLKTQFIDAWARYCDETVTPSQGRGIKYLREV